jgi:4-diphosphocytidyl-2-C-methyl-D-erythritol kinase
VPADSGNLVVRARNLLRSHSVPPPSVLPDISPSEGGGKKREISGSGPAAIHLEKDLPIASGIGGGSSDAAATLRALNRLWDLRKSLDDLADIGRELGADLPMCLHARPLMARGIGEAIEPLHGLPALDMVLVNPGVPVSTPDVFRALASRENPPLPPLPAKTDFDTLADWLAATRNDLEAPAIAVAPIVAGALDALRATGAAIARMSGSGATCFGLYPTTTAAAAAARSIRHAEPGWFVAATRSTDRP